VLRILLVRLRQIGDVIFTTPAIRALREHFPDAHLTYVVEPAAAPIVARNPHLNEVVVATRGLGQFARDLALGWRLRRARYDMALDFHGGPRSSLLTWLSGAPVRIGYDVAGRGWMYTRRVARPRALRPRHSVENQWDLLTALGLPPPDRERAPVEMPADPAVAATVRDRLARAGYRGGDRLIVVHVSAGNPFRRWPIEAFAALVAGLVRADPRRAAVVTSGPSERDAAATVIAQARAAMAPADRVRVLDCGEHSLVDLRALLDEAALYIGGDSGPLHVASTTGVPIVALYGPTLPARSAPWRPARHVTAAVEMADLPCRPCDQRVCAPGDFRCLVWLTPEQVAEAAERALR
jgi:lipopolysaccharide heptosyltransferase II